MNEFSNDPELFKVEAQLAATPLAAARARQDEILYACGFAAGECAATSRALWRWRAAAACFAFVAAGSLAGWASAHRSSSITQPSVATPQIAAPSIEPDELPLTVAGAGRLPVNLDAWTAPRYTDYDLAAFQRPLSKPRGLTVGSLSLVLDMNSKDVPN